MVGNGSGLRLMECLRLRVKDVDFEQRQISARGWTPAMARAARIVLPATLTPFLREHLSHLEHLHDDDLSRGYGSAPCRVHHSFAIHFLEDGYDIRTVQELLGHKDVKFYKNVLKLLRRGFSLNEIASILDIGRRLVEAYVEIVKKHYPTVVADHPHLHPQATGSSSVSPRCHVSQT
jgi:site-specific recombinase XerC